MAAGRTVHPDLEQKRRLVRSLRRAQRQKAEQHDRALVAATGIREAREASVFVAAAEAARPGAGCRRAGPARS